MDDATLRRVAAAVAETAELVDVRLANVSASIEPQRSTTPTPPYAIDVKLTQTVGAIEIADLPDDGTPFAVQHDYVLDIESEGERAALIECTYLAVFVHRGGSPPKREQLEAFGQTTGAFAIYPYVREMVHNLTSRFGLPVLMPIFRAVPGATPAEPPRPAKTTPRRRTTEPRKAAASRKRS